MASHPQYAIDHFGRPRTLEIRVGEYTNGRLAVELFDASDQESYSMASVNVPEQPLHDGNFIFRTYCENEGLFEELLRVGAIKQVGIAHVPFGDMPICRLLDSNHAKIS